MAQDAEDSVAGRIGGLGVSDSRQMTRTQSLKHFNAFANGAQDRPQGPWANLDAATLCTETVYEQLAYYLNELKKNASAFFAASTVISYLRVMINFAKEKFFSRGTVETREFFS